MKHHLFANLSTDKLLKRPVIICGDEEFLVIEASDYISKTLREAGFDEREIFHIDSRFDWSLVKQSLCSPSLFSDQRLLDIKFLAKYKMTKSDGEALLELCQMSPEHQDVFLLVLIPNIGWQEKKQPWYDALRQSSHLVECVAPTSAQLPGWLTQRVQAHGFSLGANEANFFAECVQGNLLAAGQAISRIRSLYQPGQTLSQHELSEAVFESSRYDLESFRMAFLQGNISESQRILLSLQEQGQPIFLILWGLAEDFRVLAQLVKEPKLSSHHFKKVRLFGARLQAIQSALQRLSAKKISDAQLFLYEIDAMAKGLIHLDPWLSIHRLLLNTARN